MKLIILFCIIVLLCLFPAFLNADEKETDSEEKSKLEKFESEIEKPKENNSTHSDEDDDDDDDGCNILCQIFVQILYEFFIGHPEYEQTYHDYLWEISLTDFPYQSPGCGIYGYQTNKKMQLQINSHYFSDLKNIDGFSIRTRWLFTPFFSLDGNFIRLNENLDSGADKMDIYDFLFNYQRFRFPTVNWWWGMGMKSVKRENYHSGICLDTGLEIFPIKPFSAQFSVNIASINNHAVSEVFTKIRYHYKQGKISLGYQRFQVESEVIKGLIIGFGIYF
ncbi:MAG: hypothetical protein KAT74_10125 [Candidatus Cloacimonetes bacterium]|nr:hypothetical protein [Candidatus Cloacimonadota bacterium]